MDGGNVQEGTANYVWLSNRTLIDGSYDESLLLDQHFGWR
jgi:hypothetical protein